MQTYVLKLSKSGSDGEKVFLLLESGTRFHTVQASQQCHSRGLACDTLGTMTASETEHLTGWQQWALQCSVAGALPRFILC
jgi:hypothetical protein